MNKSVIITALVSSLITWIFMYLDARLFDTPKTKLAYFKGMSFVAALSATIVYFMGSPSIPQIGGNAPMNIPVNQSTALVQGLNQEIFTGMPSF